MEVAPTKFARRVAGRYLHLLALEDRRRRTDPRIYLRLKPDRAGGERGDVEIALIDFDRIGILDGGRDRGCGDGLPRRLRRPVVGTDADAGDLPVGPEVAVDFDHFPMHRI